MALLVFVGAPAAIFLTITAIVWGVSRPRPFPDPERPPVGITAEASPCSVHTDADGRKVHEPAPEGINDLCWRLACAECGTPYREGPEDVHFTGPRQAITVARHRGWTLAGHRMRCRRCA
jgi:hypothetical protein